LYSDAGGELSGQQWQQQRRTVSAGSRLVERTGVLDDFMTAVYQAADKLPEPKRATLFVLKNAFCHGSWLIPEYPDVLSIHFQVKAGGAVGVAGRAGLPNGEQDGITITVKLHGYQCLQVT